VKRAFELAPDCTSIDEIRSKLRREGYDGVVEHLQGGSIQKDLRLKLGGKTREAPEPEAPTT
jgi:hypothetical protein